MPLPAALQSEIVQETLRRALPQLISDIRFRSSFSDEAVLINAREILDLLAGKQLPPTEAGRVAKEALAVAKPTVVLNSPAFGQRVWAPYGAADPKAPAMWRGKIKFWIAGGLGLIFVAGFTLGRITKKGLPEAPRVRGTFGRE